MYYRSACASQIYTLVDSESHQCACISGTHCHNTKDLYVCITGSSWHQKRMICMLIEPSLHYLCFVPLLLSARVMCHGLFLSPTFASYDACNESTSLTFENHCLLL